MSLTFGVVIFDGVEELDFVGPWEVFTMAVHDRVAGARVVTIAERAEPVTCAHGLRVLPDYTFADAPQLDVLLVPGGQGTRREIDNPVLLDWLRETAPGCTWVTSVCTGAVVLCASGLAAEKRVTTHWAALDELRAIAPRATVLGDARYVQDGNVVTAAGVSAGIDMALWLVGQLWDEDHARLTQQMMEYFPAPPYAERAGST